MSKPQNIAIIGGSGKVALHLTKILASQGRTITSVIRNPDQKPQIEQAGGNPVVLSVEEASMDDFTKLLEGKDVVVWSAGAGGKGGPERTKAVDYEGALKVFDAIEKTQSKPRLIEVSALDLRDPASAYPAHYDEKDRAMSDRVQKAIATYIKYKYETDKNLIKRTAFKWTILRPGGLTDDPVEGTGHVSMGKTHLVPTIPRRDVASVLALLVDRPDASGLAIDLVGVVAEERKPENEIVAQLDAFIKKGETDFEG